MEAQAEEQRRAREAQEAVGKANAAYQAGQMFFQLTANLSEVEAHDSLFSSSTRTRRLNAGDTLGQIEKLGWHLEHVGYVFVQTSVVVGPEMMTQGGEMRTQGYVEGATFSAAAAATDQLSCVHAVELSRFDQGSLVVGTAASSLTQFAT